MLAKCHSAAVSGVDAVDVEIEVCAKAGPPRFSIVGLPDAAVRESEDRVATAIQNSAFKFKEADVTVNLAPANLRKEGPVYDLPIAAAVLAATGQGGAGAPERLSNFALAGELALSGAVRGTRGILPIAMAAKKAGLEGIIVPAQNAAEAAVVSGIDVYAVENLREAIDFLWGRTVLKPRRENLDELLSRELDSGEDFADVKGQETAKRAIEVAVAGGHNILLIGSPGAGKTMLARRIPSILPPMSPEEALEVTRIHSVAGILKGQTSLVAHRPFRAPHHTVSDAGLLGGGTHPVPGEVSLAHCGVLFLDELPEFHRNVLEVMRQPLEDGHVVISRAAANCDFPSKFMLVAAMNPCPCGYNGDPKHECRCSQSQVMNYRNKLSGPLLDRIDIQLEVPPVPVSDLEGLERGEPSAAIRERVVAARAVQTARFAGKPSVRCNADMSGKDITEFCTMTEDAKNILRLGMEDYGLSARAYSRVLKVSRTIADLAGSEAILPEHVTEAVRYRSLDQSYWV